MNEAQFYQAVTQRSKELNLNPLLILSGVEGLYSFKDVPMNAINYSLLDSLILTIFALRIGDRFHSIAEENTKSSNAEVRGSAILELTELDSAEIAASNNAYLQSFAVMLQGRTPVRRYHEKALEVAALEIRRAQLIFENESIGVIMLAICRDEDDRLGLASMFQA